MSLFRAVFLAFFAIWPALAAAQDTSSSPAGLVAIGSMSPSEDIAGSALAPAASLRPTIRESWPSPPLMWDDHPRGAVWSDAIIGALRGYGEPLLSSVPADIDTWCPGYVRADRPQRAAFWAGMVSALAWHESSYRPRVVGGDGRWFGLIQIAPATARLYGCSARSGQALLNGASNLSCGIRIMAVTVPRDGVVSEGMRGVAADWGPFHSRYKRQDMIDWVRSQDYCQVPIPALRPTARPQ